ncbi:MAG TPA: GlsB/YeaQ/YmgE family stress response membrane protein [Thermodesulfobacteriota bacterium]|nr:GlsB/YeaQ/YmgE family stress response membrane protein [Deltaproteobacteria bacterium]HNR12108.1 GlsB/YeaQ/YmgE family stress response membrane protein [Thermodesulfobacteriota bacterium]HQO77097.1 GlsB/YeaQ/YmgE family stress response membrane protein [Thermodesulfobacteriota bacterium]
MNIIVWIIFGALAGWIASIIMGRNAEMGAIANIIVGIVGALIGGFIMNALGAPAVGGFNFYSLLVAIGGAVLLLFVVGLFRRSSKPV